MHSKFFLERAEMTFLPVSFGKNLALQGFKFGSENGEFR